VQPEILARRFTNTLARIWLKFLGGLENRELALEFPAGGFFKVRAAFAPEYFYNESRWSSHD
jgi:hypothetical protein